MKTKILFLIQLPPPVHGASAVNKSIQNSSHVNKSFSTKFINISPATGLADIGKIEPAKMLKMLKILCNVVGSFRTFKPDLVYLTLSPHGLAFYKDGLIAIVLKLMGAKLVFHLHGKGIQKEARKSWLKLQAYKLVFKKVDIIHLSDKLFSDLAEVRDPTMAIISVANGIDNSDYFNQPPKDKILTFIYLSNLIRAKGADILIRATALICKEHQKKFRVKIIGSHSSNEYVTELNELITPELTEIINISGPKYGKDKALELCTSHIFVLPTKNDCFPLSILEAMAAGLAVISTNEGAISDIVEDEVTGNVLREPSAEALAEVMIKYIEDQEYTASCSHMSQQKFLENYTQHIFERNLVLALERLTQRSKIQ